MSSCWYGGFAMETRCHTGKVKGFPWQLFGCSCLRYPFIDLCVGYCEWPWLASGYSVASRTRCYWKHSQETWRVWYAQVWTRARRLPRLWIMELFWWSRLAYPFSSLFFPLLECNIALYLFPPWSHLCFRHKLCMMISLCRIRIYCVCVCVWMGEWREVIYVSKRNHCIWQVGHVNAFVCPGNLQHTQKWILCNVADRTGFVI